MRYLAAGDAFVFLDCFIYAPHPLLLEYEVKVGAKTGTKIGCYMADFGSIYRIDCNLIDRSKSAPAEMTGLPPAHRRAKTLHSPTTVLRPLNPARLMRPSSRTIRTPASGRNSRHCAGRTMCDSNGTGRQPVRAISSGGLAIAAARLGRIDDPLVSELWGHN